MQPLPPGVREETFTYANGKQETIYRAPFESEGPILATNDGRRVLWYVYAAYVFAWPEGTTQLDIGHGSIANHMDLWQGISITGKWHPDTLAAFGQQWAKAELDRWSS